MAKLISVTLVRWIVIYPVDSVIQRLNNWGLIDLSNFLCGMTHQKHYPDLVTLLSKYIQHNLNKIKKGQQSGFF